MSANTTIHEEVQKHYGGIASAFVSTDSIQSNASCCGPSSDASCGCGEFYDAEQLKDLPDSVTGLSLGCGDPVTIAGFKPGETVLDLGSGAGIDVFQAASQVGPTGHVIGVDMTPQMLEKANANKAKLNAENVEFREGYIEALPVEDNSIDVIMSNCVINLSPDIPAVFREALRVLKPGGRFSISDVVTEGDMTPAMRKDMDLWAGCVSGAIDVNDYNAVISEAGFVDVQIVDKAQYAENVIGALPGAPRVFSARITGRKPS